MSEATMEDLTCPNPDCRIAETGKCVEGFEVGECPHQKAAAAATDATYIEDSDHEPVAEDEPSAEERQSALLVSSGEILTIDEATDVLRSGPTRVLSLIGPTKSGKTTFGLSLYDAFQNGPFDRLSFGGSRTLIAFEQRCHYARAECGNEKPDTPHTSLREGLGFLHLAVCSCEADRIDLLISDRSGEFYTRVADNLENCANLHEVSRADHVLFMVDGEKLATDERHGVKTDITMMIETLIEAGVLGKAHRVGIVLTKYDLVLSSDVTERAEMDFDNLVETLQNRFASAISEIKAFKIAARPENDAVELRFGVLEIIEECIRPRSRIDIVPKTKPTLDRSFFRLPVIEGSTK